MPPRASRVLRLLQWPLQIRKLQLVRRRPSPRQIRKLQLLRLRRLVKHIEIITDAPGLYSCRAFASSRNGRGDLLSRQNLLAIADSTIGNGECGSGAGMG